MDAKNALKHWIKTLAKHQIGMEKIKAGDKTLTIEELLAKTHFSTMETLKAEKAIEDLLAVEPGMADYYRELYQEALEELRQETE